MGTLRSGIRSLETAALETRILKAAAGLESIGVGPGDSIALFLRNDFAFVEANLAPGIIGAYPVATNWHGTVDEANYVFVNSGAKVIVIHADLYASVSEAIPDGVKTLVVPTPPEIRDAYGIADDKCAVPEGMTDWNAWVDSFPPRSEPPLEAPGTIIYTSGTTGRPKGVRRAPPTPEQAETMQALFLRGFGFTPYMDDPSGIVVGVTGPMYHSAPNAFGILSAKVGLSVILQPRFDAEDLLRLIEQRGITHLHMVPVMFTRLLRLPDDVKAKYDISSLKFVVHAAAPCPAPVKRAMIEWWGPIIHEYYGSTETNMVVFCDSEQWLAHPGTVGRVIPEADVRIIDADGNALPPGEIGEVVCKWRTVADFTYHGDDQKRRDAEKGGLIAPGDIGYLDTEGFLYLCDRAKDMIISGGVNIYPAEIEAELHKMPGVIDCAVFGIPDEEFGEAVCAAVQIAEGATVTAADVKAWLRERVAGYKVPRLVEFHAALPREDSGKIFKRKLREVHWANAGRAI